MKFGPDIVTCSVLQLTVEAVDVVVLTNGFNELQTNNQQSQSLFPQSGLSCLLSSAGLHTTSKMQKEVEIRTRMSGGSVLIS